MLAWCDAWQELVRPPSPARLDVGGSAPSAPGTEVVQVLAGMVLIVHQEGRP
jgi:hypothetical protein